MCEWINYLETGASMLFFKNITFDFLVKTKSVHY